MYWFKVRFCVKMEKLRYVKTTETKTFCWDFLTPVFPDLVSLIVREYGYKLLWKCHLHG